MMVIGIDPHKRSHTCGAVQELTGRAVGVRTAGARVEDLDAVLVWARGLEGERVGDGRRPACLGAL